MGLVAKASKSGANAAGTAAGAGMAAASTQKIDESQVSRNDRMHTSFDKRSDRASRMNVSKECDLQHSFG